MKTVKRKRKTKAKSRTIARPALSHEVFLKKISLYRNGYTFLAAVSYVFAVLVLFQFLSVQIVLGFYETPSSQSRTLFAAAQGNERPANPSAAKKSVPMLLKIPRLKVSAPIRSVGLTANGSMGIPQLPLETAWYKLGPKPGDVGSAVIAGHVNWWYGAKGVFEHLNTLKKGDRLSVLDDRGITSTFVVREIRAFGLKDDPSEVFRSYDGKAHLNLVTCSGVWDRVAKVYSKRLVVFADKVEG